MFAFATALLLCTSARAETPPDFQRDVAPILNQYCTSCHASDEPEKGLVLESYAGLVKGSQRGAVIVPGHSDRSRLVLVLDGRAKPAMPPKDNEMPTPAQIAILKRWIDAGAKGPVAGTPAAARPLVTPKVKLLTEPRRSITATAISPDGSLLALAEYQQVRLLAAKNRALVRRLSGFTGAVTALSFSRDGRWLLSAGGEPGLVGEARLWRVVDGKLERTFTGHKDSLYAAALSPDAKILATGSYDQQIKLWDTATGKELRTLTGHNGAIFDLAFQPSGKILASASADRTVKLWNVATGARLDTLSQPLKDVYSVAFSPDGRTLVSGGVDSRIRVYQISATAAENTNPLVLTRFGHEGAVLKLAYSPDGKLLASAGEDRAIRLWNTTKFIEQRALANQPDWAAGLAVSPDSKQLLLGRLDGSYGLFELASGRPVALPKPNVAAVVPRGVQRGTTTRLQISGDNLLGARGVQFSGASPAAFQVKLVEQDESRPGVLSIDLTVAPSVHRGDYALSVTTEGGTSNAAILYVDDLPQLAEREPNDTAAQTAAATLPFTSWGTIARGDRDHFRFHARAGQTLVFELEAKRIGSPLDAMLTLLDARGNALASNNNFDRQPDPLIAYRVAADGEYVVRVQDMTAAGSAAHYYRLSAGELPYVTGVFPPAVAVGRKTSLELAGYNLPANLRVDVEPREAGETAVMLKDERLRSGGKLSVLATKDNELVEREPNDAPNQAVALSTPAHASGRLWSAAGGDVDLYRFTSRKGQSWVIETMAARRGSPADTKIEVLDAAGRPVERKLLQAVLDSYVTFRAVNSSEVIIRCQNWEEMSLNQYLYFQGEICKVFRLPQGPDSGFGMYTAKGGRRGYFDTSSTAHGLDEPCYVVEPHEPGTKLTPNGLPVFTVNYQNDDDSLRELGSDSRLLFTAPADGAYLVRVSDVRGFGGDRYAYRLSVRPSEPAFQVMLANRNLTIPAGGGAALTFRAERIDGFEDDITIEFSGVPAGYSLVSPLVIEAGHVEAQAVLAADADAKPLAPADWKNLRITARGPSGSPLSTPAEIVGIASVKLAPAAELTVRLEPAELTIHPGQTISAMLKIERNGFKDRVSFNVENLPHGVIVDNIGLNGILIPENQTQRQIFLTASPDVGDTDRPCFAETKNFRGAKATAQASRPLMLHVRRPAAVAAQK